MQHLNHRSNGAYNSASTQRRQTPTTAKTTTSATTIKQNAHAAAANTTGVNENGMRSGDMSITSRCHSRRSRIRRSRSRSGGTSGAQAEHDLWQNVLHTFKSALASWVCSVRVWDAAHARCWLQQRHTNRLPKRNSKERVTESREFMACFQCHS